MKTIKLAQIHFGFGRPESHISKQPNHMLELSQNPVSVAVHCSGTLHLGRLVPGF